MKKLLYGAVFLLTVALVISVYLTRAKRIANSQAYVASNSVAQRTTAPAVVKEEQPQSPLTNPSSPPEYSVPVIAAPGPGPDKLNMLQQTVDTLVSPHATFEIKQRAWDQLSNTNLLNEAIADLEKRTRENPAIPESHAALGMAYLRKCGMIPDVREMGILAMNADKSFDSALELDPSNWDARFTKAVAMSFWPDHLNKRSEVLEHFRILLEQQEAAPRQPHFAMTYLKLGEQYQKAGYADYARQVYERGASLYPENRELLAKLTPE